MLDATGEHVADGLLDVFGDLHVVDLEVDGVVDLGFALAAVETENGGGC